MRSWFMIVVTLFALVLTAAVSIYAYVSMRQFFAESPVSMPAPPGAVDVPTQVSLFNSTPTLSPTVGAASSATSAATLLATQSATPNATPNANATPTSVMWTDPARITVLLLGIDQRKGEKGPFRTDTIMVLSIDPIRKTAAMISIPRDIYIKIPGYNTTDRINNANVIGDVNKYPGGGPALARKTIQSLLGVPIQRYAIVNFDVFTTVIDALGPINVCPEQRIHDDKYPDGSYGYITVDFPAGCQDLDSTKLLQYARVRHNAGDDFGRAKRQQEVIQSVRQKVTSLGGVSALLGKAGEIWGSLKDSIKTDLSFDDMVQLAQLAQTIPKENIRSAVITDKDGYLIPSKLPSGEEVFSPIYEKIHDLVENLFEAAPRGPANSQASAEGAKIIVSNGAGVDGLAKAAADKLSSQGFVILDAKNADQPGGYGKTVIRLYAADKLKTARYLAEVLGLDGNVIVNEKGGPPGVDIELILGKDLASLLK